MEQFLSRIEELEGLQEEDLVNWCVENLVVILTVVAVATLAVMTCWA